MAATKIRGNTQIQAGTITDAEIASGAAIALSKLSEAVIQADGGQAFTADQSLGGNRLTNVGSPSGANDAATKAYVDAAVNGFDWKASVRAATTANIALSGTQTIDGVDVVAGDRVLVKNQTTPADNGIYVAAAGAWARSADADAADEVSAGLSVFVSEGITNGNTSWVLTTDDPITLGSTSLVFAQVSGGSGVTAGDGLTQSGNTLNVVAADSSLTVNADSVQVALATNGGLEVSSGVKVKLDGSSLALGAGGIKVVGSNFVVRETPSGAINGSNAVFTLANTPLAGSESVFLNGLLQEPGGEDYSISGATITFASAPIAGDRIRVSYMKNNF